MLLTLSYLFSFLPLFLILSDSPDSSALDKKHNDVLRGDPSGGQHLLPDPHPDHRMSMSGEIAGRQPAKASSSKPHGDPGSTASSILFHVNRLQFQGSLPLPAQGHFSQKTTLPFLSSQRQTCQTDGRVCHLSNGRLRFVVPRIEPGTSQTRGKLDH